MSAAEGQKMALSTVKTLLSLLEQMKLSCHSIRMPKKERQILIHVLMVPACLVKDFLRKRLTKDLCITTTLAKICTELDDLLVNGIRNCFDQPGYANLKYMQLELWLLKGARGENFEKEFDLVTDFYNADINAKNLRVQFQTLKCNFPKDITTSIQTITEFIKTEGILLYSEIAVLIELLLVMPATNATSERMFSILRRIKSYLRSTMSQVRPNNLMILHIYQEETANLDLRGVANEFIGENEHRLSVFGKF
jgi:hypothetical protein